MTHRRRLIPALVCALALATSGPIAVAGRAGAIPESSPAPRLWAGQVVDRNGQPAAAHVSVFLRPPPSAIPMQGEDRAAPPSIPMGQVETGPDGRFEVRAAAPVLPPEYRHRGWYHVMLLAQGEDGWWTIATDSVRWLPAGNGQPEAAWLSNFVSAERTEELRTGGLAGEELMAAIERLADEELAGDMERPSVIQLREPRPAGQAAAAQPLAWKKPGDPWTGCSARHVEGRQKGFRTISDIDLAKDWSYSLEYKETKTTAWEVGYEASGGNWKVGGTASFSDTSDAGFDTKFNPFPDGFRESFQVELMHAKVLWECTRKDSPSRFPVRTVEPENWTGGTFNTGEPIISCVSMYEIPVSRDTEFYRGSGKSSKYSAGTEVFGFKGQAAVTYNKTIRLGWRNFADHPRPVCGESDHPKDGNTRVAAMPG